MQSKWYDRIRSYYISGLWSREQVIAVTGKALTETEVAEILASKK